MRSFLFALALLLPRFGWAQLDHFESGSYVLASAPGVRQFGQVKLRNGNTLAVKTAAGKKITLTPEEVVSFRIGPSRGTTETVEASDGLVGYVTKRQFVELLDSGQVMLLRHVRYTGSGSGGGTTVYEYLVRSPQQAQAASLSITTSAMSFRKKAQKSLLPYLTTRPDLTQLVTDHALLADELVLVIHALNRGVAYVRPSVVLPFGVE